MNNFSQSGAKNSINLGSAEVARDLQTLILRIRSVDKNSAVRLLARGNLLAMYVSTMSPETLLDTAPTILGMRAVQLAEATEVDVVVESSALLDRLARIEEENYYLRVPPVTVNATWAGITPPVSGWVEKKPLAASLLFATAEAGMKAVDDALPQNPGHAVVSTVRSRIWSSPLNSSQSGENDLEVPSAVAFTAVVLGFLPQKYEGEIRLFTCGDWVRLNAPAGFVLVKRNQGI
ncbi:transcriptional regulator [uncultured Rothia sp.]|uniref:transcriptional regulator n=1 Tax=uncultured Rothia sp. TaxID=316088 RepID=UPI0032174A40